MDDSLLDEIIGENNTNSRIENGNDKYLSDRVNSNVETYDGFSREIEELNMCENDIESELDLDFLAIGVDNEVEVKFEDDILSKTIDLNNVTTLEKGFGTGFGSETIYEDSILSGSVTKSEPTSSDIVEQLDGLILSSCDLHKTHKNRGKCNKQTEEERKNNEIREKLHNTCCLCGHTREGHTQAKRHRFFPCLEEYRCKKCLEFFYQHSHTNNPCFQPFKHIA